MLVATSGDPLKRSWQRVAVCVFLVFGSGCVTNHRFVRGEELDVSALVSELETKSEEDDALFDITYVPFAHLDLQVFAENDENPHYPEGHAFISVRSWLPLFGIVDGNIELYDAEQAAYEKQEFRSLLWGLWTRERTTVQTGHGERTERNHSLLWILDWGPSAHYDLPAEG
jgi:hypothetical protein